jgi:hypothetical protein
MLTEMRGGFGDAVRLPSQLELRQSFGAKPPRSRNQAASADDERERQPVVALAAYGLQRGGVNPRFRGDEFVQPPNAQH